MAMSARIHSSTFYHCFRNPCLRTRIHHHAGDDEPLAMTHDEPLAMTHEPRASSLAGTGTSGSNLLLTRATRT